MYTKLIFAELKKRLFFNMSAEATLLAGLKKLETEMAADRVNLNQVKIYVFRDKNKQNVKRVRDFFEFLFF